MIDVLYFADAAVNQKLFARVQKAKKLTLVTVLPPHRATDKPKLLTPFKELERDFGDAVDQVLVLDEGKVEGMWRDPVVDLADAMYPNDKKAAYAAARGYLFVLRGEPKLVVKKSNDHDADLERLEKAIEKLSLTRKPKPPPRASAARTLDDSASTAETADAYGVLGLSPGATLDEAKSAWKALIVQYHPDKVAHLAPEFRALAEKKTRELNEAWEMIRGSLDD